MKKFTFYSLFALTLFSLVGTGVAYAKGPNGTNANGNNQTNKGYGYETMISDKAETLGVSVDDLKADLAEGKTFLEIAEAQGLTSDDLHEVMTTQATARINQRVANGNLTQEQANERLANMAERQGDCTGEGPLGQGNGQGAGQNGQGQRLMIHR